MSAIPPQKKTRFAILGLLSWQPLSGYDIKKLIEMGLSHFWSESYGQLYPTLSQLVVQGLATRKTDPTSGKRTRYVFTITAQGRKELRSWLHDPSDLPRMRNEFLLKFFLSGRQPVDESIRLLTEYRDQQQARHELYTASQKILTRAVRLGVLPDEVAHILTHDKPAGGGSKAGTSRQALLFLLTLRHGVLAIESRLAWCDEAIKAIRSQRSPAGARS